MSNAPQLDSMLARRLLRDTDAQRGQVAKSPTVAVHPSAQRGPVDAIASEEEIANSIRMIERAASIVDMLQDTISKHEDTIYTLNNDLAEAGRQKDEAFQEVVKAEQMIRAERDRVVRAEARATSSETRIGDLERQNAALSAQLERLMRAIASSLSHDAGTGRRDGDLKLVS